MKNIFKKLKRNIEGATAVEFAFAFPVVLVFTFMFFELCLLAYTQSVLSYSAAQSSRYAMVNIIQANTTDEDYVADKEDEIEAYAKKQLLLVDPDNVKVVATTLVPNTFTTTINVAITYAYSTSMPLLPSYDFTLTADSNSFLAR